MLISAPVTGAEHISLAQAVDPGFRNSAQCGHWSQESSISPSQSGHVGATGWGCSIVVSVRLEAGRFLGLGARPSERGPVLFFTDSVAGAVARARRREGLATGVPSLSGLSAALACTGRGSRSIFK
jgi:hypothetical protein